VSAKPLLSFTKGLRIDMSALSSLLCSALAASLGYQMVAPAPADQCFTVQATIE
jgi:hypothetical protein